MNESRPKPKRRWLQFSLRTLLVFVTLSAFASGWFVVKMQRARRQREAVKAIVEAGGRVWYDYEVNAPTGSVPKPPGPAWMRKLLGENRLRGISMPISLFLRALTTCQFLIGCAVVEELGSPGGPQACPSFGHCVG